MKQCDIESYCDDYHDDASEWVMEELRLHDLPCSKLTEGVLRTLMISLSCANPRNLAECHFRLRPELPGGDGPWRFLSPPHPNQSEAAEYKGDMVIHGGYASGKTMVLVAKAVQTLAIVGSTCIVASHTTTAKETLFGEMEYQILRSPFLRSLVPKGSIRRGNRWHMIGPRGNVCHFPLSGVAGEQFLSIHVGIGGIAIADEAARWNNRAWNPFFSRIRPGADVVIASVPYGDPGNLFEVFVKNSISLADMRQRVARGGIIAKRARALRVGFHFNRETLPETMWNDNEERKAIVAHGPKTGAKYQSWVIGKVVDSDNAVFSSIEIGKVFHYDPSYRLFRVTWDEKESSVLCCVFKIDEIDRESLVEVREKRVLGHDLFNVVKWIDSVFPPVACDVVGYDYGRRQDPAEIKCAEVIERYTPRSNAAIIGRARIQLNHAPYPIQARILSYLSNRSKYGCGIEASGGSDTHPVYQFMTDLGECDMKKVRLYAWQRRIVIKTRPNTENQSGRLQRVGGNQVKTKTIGDQVENEGEIFRRLKHHATLGIHAKIEADLWKEPNDPEVIDQWKKHGSRLTANDVEYDIENDHTIEAARVTLLAVADALGEHFTVVQK